MNAAYIITLPLRILLATFMTLMAPLWFFVACLDDDVYDAWEETKEMIAQFFKP